MISALSPSNPAIALFSNLVTFLASGLLSYFITFSNERRQFSEDLAKFADFSRRRVNLLSANLLSLTKEIENIPTAEETKRIVSYTLQNLEQDARASVKDIEAMGRIQSATELAVSISEPSLLFDQLVPTNINSQEIALIPVVQTITYNCKSCGQSGQTELGTAPGTTKAITCGNCDSRLNLHRLSSGGFKVVAISTSASLMGTDPWRRLSPYARTVHDKFDCPRCKNPIAFSTTDDVLVVEKPCFSCFAICTFDRNSRTVRAELNRPPIYVDSIDSERMYCKSCGTLFSPRKFSNADGTDLICCFNCNTIYLEKKERKILVCKECPTIDCGNELKFKVSETHPEAKQFCLDCANRFSYDRRTDEITLVEKLSIPKISEIDFHRRGDTCPHCNYPTSGRWTKNKWGEHLSICWQCKGVFEIEQMGSHSELEQLE